MISLGFLHDTFFNVSQLFLLLFSSCAKLGLTPSFGCTEMKLIQVFDSGFEYKHCFFKCFLLPNILASWYQFSSLTYVVEGFQSYHPPFVCIKRWIAYLYSCCSKVKPKLSKCLSALWVAVFAVCCPSKSKHLLNVYIKQRSRWDKLRRSSSLSQDEAGTSVMALVQLFLIFHLLC